jgi:hypothetical protein
VAKVVAVVSTVLAAMMSALVGAAVGVAATSIPIACNNPPRAVVTNKSKLGGEPSASMVDGSLVLNEVNRGSLC